MGVRGTRWHFELLLTKPGLSWFTACHSLEKCCTTNNGGTTGATHVDTTTPAQFCSEHSYPGLYEISYSLSHSDGRSHMHSHTQALAQQSSGARLLWLKIRGGIINHTSLPLVKSGLSWCERSAVPAEQRQALAGWRARGACRGFPPHPEAYQSCGRWMDG